VKKIVFACLMVGLCALIGGVACAADQLQIIFNDGTSQTVNLNKPFHSIKSIHFQEDLAVSSPGNIVVVAGTYGKNCGAAYGNKTGHLAGACNNQARCEYIIDYRVIGDPAVGCGKDYVAEWRCGSDGTTHQTSASPEAGFNKKIILACP